MKKFLRMSELFVRTLREDPVKAEVVSHKLLIRAGYIRQAAPGIYSWLPLGLQVKRKIEAIIREEMEAIGAQEVHFPALLPREPYEASGRWHEYGDHLFRLKDRKGSDYLLAPTHEEMFTLLVKDLFTSYKDLPIMLYQIQDKYRDEARPRAGLLRGREFTMKDAYSFDVKLEGLETSYQAMRTAYLTIFKRLGLDVIPVSAVAGAMGGSKSEEFLHPTAVGEDTFVRSAGGYAANTEAVKTVVPLVDHATVIPECTVLDTPKSTTIEALVEVVNHAGYSIKASHTLKNVAVVAVDPNGKREILVIGLPGDRSVDMKRLEANANMGEITVEAASKAELDAHGLIAGYIGPGLSKDESFLGLHGTTGLRYLVDPRIADGTAWVTGANAVQKHVVNLVAGRDFTHDGFIECAEVKAGDMAADGSGPLEIARGIEMGHIFQLGTKYAQALGLKVLDEHGKNVVVTMGSYGIGVTRTLAALAEKFSDDQGLCWPAHLAPAQVHILMMGKDENIKHKAEEIAQNLSHHRLDVLLDDRLTASPGVKFRDAELLGIPYILVVGRGVKEEKVELKNRAETTSQEMNISEVLPVLSRLLNCSDSTARVH